MPRCGVHRASRAEGEGLMCSPAEKLSGRDMASVRAAGDEDKIG